MSAEAIALDPGLAEAILLGLAACFLALFFGIAVHEIGHAIAARLVGARVRSIRIGIAGKAVSFELGGTKISVHPLPLGGLTIARTASRSRNIAFVMGGSVANAVVGGALLAAFPRNGPVAFLAAIDLATGLSTLVPLSAGKRMGCAKSDGLNLLGLIVGKKARYDMRDESSAAIKGIRAMRGDDPESAIESFREAARGPDKPWLAQALLALSLVASADEANKKEGLALTKSTLNEVDLTVEASGLSPLTRGVTAVKLADALYRNGDVDGAIEGLRRHEPHWPRPFPRGDAQLATFLRIQADEGSWEESRVLAQRAFSAPPSGESESLTGPMRGWVANHIAFDLVRSGPVEDAGELAKAAELALEAHRLLPGDPGVIDTLALVRVRQGRPDEAELLVRPLLSEVGDGPLGAAIACTLALAMLDLDRADEARPLADQASAVDAGSYLLGEVRSRLDKLL
jgi:tetratricopeptide (TPR) repeat protein